MSITGNSKGQATRWLLNQPGQQLDIRASIERLAPGLEVLELKIRQSLNISEKEQVQNHAESLIEGGMPKTLAYRAASLHLLLPALDVVEMAARRKTDVLGVAGVFFGLAESLSLGWLRESVENLAVEGQWHAHARSNLRDELYSQHRNPK